ncbi:hypothetical protein HDU82_004878 [Entophlyctis luteolus]|nr:hypothetical protein HDU82_004878 [Entophlyctis luteolus]
MVRQYKVLLDDLDPLQAHKVVDGKLVRNSPSAIDIAVQNGDKEMLSHPLMVAILKIKWALYARKSFMFGFAVAFLLMLFFTTAIALQPSSLEQRRSYTFSDPYSIARFVFEVLTIVSTIVVVRGEINEIRVQKAKYLTGHGASENLRQWVLSILIWVVPILRWGVAAAAPNSSETIRDTENVIMGIASIWGWISLLEFAQGFEGTGPLVLIFTRMVFGDFLSWMSLYTVLTVGFAAALFLQMQNVPYLTTENFAPSYDWDQIAGAILWTSRFIFMQAIFDDFRSSRIPAFTELLYIIYGFVVLILLLNVLIAMLAETLKAIASDSERHWRVQFAELLLKTDEALSPRHREFFLRHLGWFDKPAPKEKGDSEDAKSAPSTSGTIEELTESRYFVFTERDVLKLDPATEKKVKTVQTLKFVVARGHGNRPIEIDSNKSHWDSWFADLARIVSDGEEMQTSWWRNHHMRVQHEVAESKYKIIAKQMRLDALRKMGVANPEWEE